MTISKGVLGILAVGLVAAAGCASNDADSAAKPTAAAPAEATAADDRADPPADRLALPDEVGAIEVDALDSLITSEQATVHVFDANGDKTRREHGYIPGAKLLDDYKNCAAALPEARGEKLVFYCYNEMCGASHEAAKQAVLAGYADVNVLPAGIVGWKQAGKKTETM